MTPPPSTLKQVLEGLLKDTKHLHHNYNPSRTERGNKTYGVSFESDRAKPSILPHSQRSDKVMQHRLNTLTKLPEKTDAIKQEIEDLGYWIKQIDVSYFLVEQMCISCSCSIRSI